MRRLLSLPPNAVTDYYQLNGRDRNEWFCTSDPRDKRLGSGGGTTWLLEECYRDENPGVAFEAEKAHTYTPPAAPNENSGVAFEEWLSKEKRVLIHAGGTKQKASRLRGRGQNEYPHTGVSLGTGAKGETGLAVAANAAVRENHGAIAPYPENPNRERRCLYSHRKTSTGDPRSRHRLLRALGGRLIGNPTRRVRIVKGDARGAGLHAAKTVVTGVGGFGPLALFLDGHRDLAS